MEIRGKECTGTHLPPTASADLFSFKGFLVLPHFGEGVGSRKRDGGYVAQ